MSIRCPNCPNIFQPTSATKPQWTQLKSLLRGNCHPSRVTSEIFQLLSGAENDLQRCEAKIARQQSYISTYSRSRTNVRCCSVTLMDINPSSRLSPVRKLPPEILRQIFQYVCTENRLDKEQPDIPGLILGQVSFHWRSIALSTRPFWSTIVVNAESAPFSTNGHRPLGFCWKSRTRIH
ncbi:hypothetical protein C8J56DRAFT_126506 [Mycena floridula]|nr:hypothetical protein C8J56DRAFT_126506 [Mycena floridula]